MIRDAQHGALCSSCPLMRDGGREALGDHLTRPLDDVVPSEALEARESLRDLCDPLRNPKFWEGWVALTCGGRVTPHKAEADVEVTIAGVPYRVEVKYATAFWSAHRVRGEDFSHWKYKWSRPRGRSGKRGVQCLVLIGLDDELESVDLWALPIDEVSESRASIAVTAPRSRRYGGSSKWDRWRAPADRLRPRVESICRGRRGVTVDDEGDRP